MPKNLADQLDDLRHDINGSDCSPQLLGEHLLQLCVIVTQLEARELRHEQRVHHAAGQRIDVPIEISLPTAPPDPAVRELTRVAQADALAWMAADIRDVITKGLARRGLENTEDMRERPYASLESVARLCDRRADLVRRGHSLAEITAMTDRRWDLDFGVKQRAED